MKSNPRPPEREGATGQELNFPTRPTPLPPASPLHSPSCLTCLGKRTDSGLEIGA